MPSPLVISGGGYQEVCCRIAILLLLIPLANVDPVACQAAVGWGRASAAANTSALIRIRIRAGISKGEDRFGIPW